MGQTSSNVMRKVGTWWTGDPHSNNSRDLVVSPFVYKRRSSLYMDEDGDQAHEFYEERFVDKKGHYRYMKKLRTNLQPVGDIDLPHPRLHVDFPIVICEAPIR